MEMGDTWWFVVGVVIGGLSIWLVMQERLGKLEAMLEVRTARQHFTDPVPKVKTREIGKGSRSKLTKPAESSTKTAADSKSEEE